MDFCVDHLSPDIQSLIEENKLTNYRRVYITFQ